MAFCIYILMFFTSELKFLMKSYVSIVIHFSMFNQIY